MKFLKVFENEAGYQAYADSPEYVEPHVSLAEAEGDVHYNLPPLPIIASWLGGGEASAILDGVEPYVKPSPMKSDKALTAIKFPSEATELLSLDTTHLTKVDLSDVEYSSQIIQQVEEIVDTDVEVIEPLQPIPNNEIWYWTSDETILSTGNDKLQAMGLVSDEYINGKGVMKFDKDVTEISNTAFSACTSLTSIEIPNSVTSIGNYAFDYCYNLTSVTIGNSVTSIGYCAFSRCTRIEEITCNAAVAPQIKQDTFQNIARNGILYTPEGSDYSSWMSTSSYYLGYYNWMNNPEEIEITYTSTDGNIVTPYYNSSAIVVSNEYADGVGKLKFISTKGVLPNNIFYDKTYLESVTIPDSVTNIGEWAFRGCTGLANITIPDSVTSIGKQAFYNCSKLTNITIPDYVTIIEDYAFQNCTSLTSVTIGNSVTSIGNGAFSGCTSLTSVTIPNSVTSIGQGVFQSCSSLTSIGPKGSGASVEIPDSVTNIGGSAFSSCYNLTSIDIPDSVTNIGVSAFYYCNRLTSITIGNSVTSIGSYAFYNCESLTSVTIPDSVTSIGDKAFQNCTSLTSVTIGNSVTSIGSSAFYYCTSLVRITYNGTKSQWNAITKGTNWNYKVLASSVRCTDGNIFI